MSVMNLPHRFEEPLKEYAVTVKVRNNFLLQRMRAAGYETANELARASGVHNSAIGRLLNLKEGAINHWERWRPAVLKLAEHLKCLPEDLVPPQHQRTGLETNTAEFEASEEDVKSFAYLTSSPSPQVELIRQQSSERIEQVLAGLTPRQQQIIRMRFGFEGPDLTYRAISDRMNVSVERIRQIELKVLRKLKGKQHYRELLQILRDQEIWT